MLLTVAAFALLLVATQPEPVDLCLQAAQSRQQGNLERAEGLLKQCLAENPSDIRPYLWLSGLYQETGQGEELYQMASRGLELFPGELRFYYAVGLHQARNGECERAVQVFEEAHRRWPEEDGIQNNLVQSLRCLGLDAIDQGQDRRAVDALSRLVELAPEDLDALTNLGRAQHNLQLSSDALTTFNRVFNLNPETPTIRYHQGVALYALGRFDETVAVLDQQINETPGHTRSYYFRGLAHFYKGNWNEALADLTVATRGMPEFGDAVYRLGRCFDHFGRTAEAEEAFRRSARLDPSDVRPLYALGNMLERLGRTAEAEELLSRAVELYEQKIAAPPSSLRFDSTRKE
ncbi:MAG: tetratricopeptide repeat protein [Acidobacteriota bacterium]|nr:MAG: tetratricopeptide repeat protein [Acidobacteriota bacterium]